jgi:hypothetical protein
VALGAAAWRLGGIAVAWASAALLLGSGYALERMTDASPRAWAFPLLSLVLAALVFGRPFLLAGIVVVAVLVYPPVSVCAGLCLAILLLALPARDRGAAQSWSLSKRLGVVAATAALAVLAWLPLRSSTAPYGPYIVPSSYAEYPEAGPAGRLTTLADRVPGPGWFVTFRRSVKKGIYGTGVPLLPPVHRRLGELGHGRWLVFVAISLAGWTLLARRRPEARRPAALAISAFAAYAVAVQVYPRLYLPERYLGYPIPVLLAVLLPAGTRALVESGTGAVSRTRRHAGRIGSAAVVALAAALGGRSAPDAGLTVRVDPQAEIYAAVSKLPADALIGGWPRGTLDNIPYLTKRQVLLSFEVHQPYHSRYVSSMRARMEALVSAYWATSPEPIIELRDRFGVTHLLVDSNILEQPPRYFEPFEESVRRAVARAGGDYEVLRQAARAAVFRDHRHVLLDLSLVAAPAAAVVPRPG